MSIDESSTMKLQLGVEVRATDAIFGEIGDIVVDPETRAVTHLVIEPHHAHHMARLVPLWLVTVEKDHVRVELDIARLRQLERVAFRDFIEVGEHLDVGGQWDVGTSDFVTLPYVDRATANELGIDNVRAGIEVEYDRVPRGYCEVRRSSDVATTDDHVVGHVDGFVVEGDRIASLLVRGRLGGLGRRVVVPVANIAEVRNDFVGLNLSRHDFRRLPRTRGDERPDS